MAAEHRKKNRYALVAYQKGQPLEGGGRIVFEGEEIDIRTGETLVLRLRGYDARGKGIQPIEIAVQCLEDPYR
jgi:hypothetical protein